MNRVEEV